LAAQDDYRKLKATVDALRAARHGCNSLAILREIKRWNEVVMHIDQTTFCEGWCRRKERHEASKSGTCHRAQSRRSYPRNKASTLAAGRNGVSIAASQAATRRSLRGIIVHAAPSQREDVGRGPRLRVLFPANSSCLVYINRLITQAYRKVTFFSVFDNFLSLLTWLSVTIRWRPELESRWSH
jgi:hypothetical protein